MAWQFKSVDKKKKVCPNCKILPWLSMKLVHLGILGLPLKPSLRWCIDRPPGISLHFKWVFDGALILRKGRNGIFNKGIRILLRHNYISRYFDVLKIWHPHLDYNCWNSIQTMQIEYLSRFNLDKTITLVDVYLLAFYILPRATKKNMRSSFIISGSFNQNFVDLVILK